MKSKNNSNLLPEIPSLEDDTFYSTFGNGRRIEVKSRGFVYNKLQICLQAFNEQNKQTAYVPFYMGVEKALVMANDILSGRYAQLAKAKSKGDGSIVEVFSICGGQKAESARRPDKKPEFKSFTISKGKRWLLKATSGPGATTENGGIVADGAPDASVSIGLSDDALKEFAIMIQQNYSAFLTAQYTMLAFSKENQDKIKAKSSGQSYGERMNSEFDFD